MKISIIIPTYKPKEYLWQCLDSIDRQITDNFCYEVILVLNGPKEPYYSKINQYISNHPTLNIIFLYNDVAGVSAARNSALEIATGDYITFIDDDDYMSPSYLYNMSLKAAPNRIVMARAHAFDDTTGKEMPYRITQEYDSAVSKGELPAFAVRSIYGGVWMKLIPACYIQQARFDISLKNSEDALFIFEISHRFDKIICASNDTIYYRRVREGSAMKISTSRKAFNALRMAIKYTLTYIKKPFSYNFLFYITRVLGAVKGVLAKDNY